MRSAPPLEEPVELIAVLPLERAEADHVRLPEGAEQTVTAQIYAVLAENPRFRFVPDLAVIEALRKVDRKLPVEQRAVALGRAVGADAVLYGTVERFVEREGGPYGAKKPASVSFGLALVSVKSGQVLWQSRFDQTQQPLTANLFNWWMFWRAGPRWFSAEELARLGAERLLDDLGRRLR
ncbi:MAG: penicillin-binding protein activator LpoB [Candidatus Binatia bacterium]|nr:penicillin-binding protein activator LpoB [Candidatus Binatia bacterium]